MAYDSEFPFALTNQDLFQKTNFFGKHTIGEVEHGDIIVPFRFQPYYIKKTSHYFRPQTEGFITFQCVIEPPNLLHSHVDKEGLFTCNEVCKHFFDLTDDVWEEYNKDLKLKAYYEAYKPYFVPSRNFTKFIRIFGITSTGNMSKDEIAANSHQTNYCMFGKVPHRVLFPYHMCDGIINEPGFLPRPHTKFFGDIHVFLVHDKEEKLRFYFTDNPNFDTLNIEEEKRNKDKFFYASIKIGFFQPSDISFAITYIHDVKHYEAHGFIFSPDTEQTFVQNDTGEGRIRYVGEVPSFDPNDDDVFYIFPPQQQQQNIKVVQGADTFWGANPPNINNFADGFTPYYISSSCNL